MSVITLTGYPKESIENLMQKLSETLGYHAINKELISECARKYNIMEEELREVLEEVPTGWERLTGYKKRLLIYIQSSLLIEAAKDNLIYYGPCGQIFLSGINNVFKLRIEEPLHKRIISVMKNMNMSHSDAEKYIHNMDKQKNRLVKILFNDDLTNPTSYDMSVNLEQLSINTVCDMVRTAVKSEEFRTNEQSKEIIKNMILESEVKAALYTDNQIQNLPISITVSGDTVTIRGTVKNKKQRDAIVELILQVKGVKNCEDNLNLLSSPIKIHK